ncbi:6-carboxyhexanoate--CoA ligase [Aneurinibacillus sp. REN35]|uniref:6-carboxyhexanoate--CoA ligase n=1 Tax=Aneurinibacillus sp. REN35 TaxID=3237286 RepID=UPI00352808EE
MSSEPLYSMRMRAAQGGSHEEGGIHISGGERLSTEAEIEALACELLHKALHHSRGTADFINLIIEQVRDTDCAMLPPLSVSTYEAEDDHAGRQQAFSLLRQASVSAQAIERGLAILGDVHNLRGAVLLDRISGERLDARGIKGVRVSRMDWNRESLRIWRKKYPAFSSARIAEAIALATKVAHAQGTIAELCWSDDPEYVTGYVASPTLGYCRITHMKKSGDFSGGRVFFVESDQSLAAYIEYLEQTPVWIG